MGGRCLHDTRQYKYTAVLQSVCTSRGSFYLQQINVRMYTITRQTEQYQRENHTRAKQVLDDTRTNHRTRTVLDKRNTGTWCSGTKQGLDNKSYDKTNAYSQYDRTLQHPNTTQGQSQLVQNKNWTVTSRTTQGQKKKTRTDDTNIHIAQYLVLAQQTSHLKILN